MNKTIYKQTDPRWARKPYPNKNSSFGGNGCGCCACLHVALEQKKYAKWTPENLRPWMIKQGFAISGQGTTWAGIPATLKHLGHKSVVWVGRKDPMSMVWKECNKGNRIGVILFKAGRTPNGTVWTTSGHYIAFTDYRLLKNGQHQFYLKDSGGRNHSGWWTYEKSMRNCVSQVFIVERIKETTPKKTTTTAKNPVKTEKKGYSGTFPATNGGQRMINEAASQKGKYPSRTNHGKDGKPYSNKFTKYFAGKAGINSKGEMPNVYGYIPGYCTLFGVYCAVICGFSDIIPLSKLVNKTNGYWWHSPSLLKYFKSAGKTVPIGKAKKGAYMFKGDKSPTHTCLFDKAEGNYIYTWDGNIDGGVTYNKRKKSAYCGCANPSYRNYMKKGDGGIDVQRWQLFLNWYFGKKVLEPDGVFGDMTDKYSKQFQKDMNLGADGLVGEVTVGKAKAVKK